MVGNGIEMTANIATVNTGVNHFMSRRDIRKGFNLSIQMFNQICRGDYQLVT